MCGYPEDPPASCADDAATLRRRPDGVTDAAVHAAGKVSEAFEAIEEARGHLYAFHRLIGHADLQLGDAVEQLRESGYPELAEQIGRELVGRNVLPGRWSFQVVEDYDDGYYLCFKQMERLVRDRLMAGRRHVLEAEMKEGRRTRGHPAHTASPTGSGPDGVAHEQR
jgi:hypothetical protein